MSTASYLQQAAQAQMARLQLRKLRHPAKAIETVVNRLLTAGAARSAGAAIQSLDAAGATAAQQEVLQDVNTLYILLVAERVAAGLERHDLALDLARELAAQQRSQARLIPPDLTTLKTSAEALSATVLVDARAAQHTAAGPAALPATGAAVASLLRDLYEELLALEWTAAGNLKRTNTRRRLHGAYYTPLPVARAIAARALAPVLSGCQNVKAVLDLRIVDPMMGPGVFLQAGGECLVARALELAATAATGSASNATAPHSLETLWPIVAANCLYGVDLDGDAARVGAIAIAFLSGAPLSAMHCRAGNSLVGSVRAEVVVEARVEKQLRAVHAARLLGRAGQRGPAATTSSAIEELPEPFLNWAREFPEVFGGAREGRPGWNGMRLTGGFDALLSNPPYVSYYSRDSVKKSAACLEEEFFHSAGILDQPLPETLRGRTNLFLLALFAGEQLLAREVAGGRVAGAAGWLLPDTFLSNESYAGWRRYFLEAARMTAVEWVRGDLFGEPSLGSSVVYFGDAREGIVSVDLHNAAGAANSAAAPAKRGRPRSRKTAPVSADAGTAATVVPAPTLLTTAEAPRHEQFAVAEILQFPHLVIPTMPRATRSLVARIEAASVPVTGWMDVRDGVNPGPRSFRDKILLAAPDASDASVRQLIVGGDIEPFRVKPSTRWIRHNPKLLTTAIRKQGASFRAPELFEGPKLVSRQTASHPIAALDLDRRSAINSVHIMIPAGSLGFDTEPAGALLLVLGCLNATPLTWYYRQRWMENRRVFPQVHISSLRQLPIPAAFRAAAAAEPVVDCVAGVVSAADRTGAMAAWLESTGMGRQDAERTADGRARINQLVLAAWGISSAEWTKAA